MENGGPFLVYLGAAIGITAVVLAILAPVVIVIDPVLRRAFVRWLGGAR